MSFINEVFDSNGILIERWDDATRIWTSHSPNPVLSRTYAEKSVDDGFSAAYYDSLADRRAATQTLITQREADRVIVKTIISDIQLERDRAQTVIDNVSSTAREKDLARAIKRIGAATIDLARFVKDL